MKIAVLCSRVRVEEKWLFASLEERSIDFYRIDDRRVALNLQDSGPWAIFAAVLERSPIPRCH